jgi:hypothetical protein
MFEIANDCQTFPPVLPDIGGFRVILPLCGALPRAKQPENAKGFSGCFFGLLIR